MDVPTLLQRFPLARMPQRPLRVGVVGCGWIATSAHFPAVQFLQAQGWPINMTALCDLDPARRAAAATMFPAARVFADAGEQFSSGLSEATLILAQPNACVPLCQAAIEAGQIVLVEKPVASDAETIQRLAEFAAARDAQVQVAYNRRHQPLLARFREEVGRAAPQHVIARFYRVARAEPDFYTDTAIHQVDLLGHLFGPLEVVDSSAWPAVADGALHSGMRVDFRSAAGLSVEMDIRPAAGRLLETMEVISDRRSVYLSYQQRPQPFDPPELSVYDNGAQTTIYRHPADDTAGLAGVFFQGFIHQMASFCSLASGGGAQPVCTLQDAAVSRRLVTRMVAAR